MRILKNLTREEIDYYASRPTAKEMHERIMKDSVYIPEGEASAAAVYVAGRDAEKTVNRTDTVEISQAGREFNRVSVSFSNSAMVHRAVKQGSIEIDGKKVELSDDVKKQLLAADAQIQNARNAVSLRNMLMREAANARQTSDAMKEANDRMSRAMTTASRIMHGRKVSPADEKELMEFNKDLYAMAKSAAALEKHRHRKDHDEDDKISAENDAARAREAEPKDYSVEEAPMPQNEVQMDVSFDGDTPQVTAVGAGLPMEFHGEGQ